MSSGFRLGASAGGDREAKFHGSCILSISCDATCMHRLYQRTNFSAAKACHFYYEQYNPQRIDVLDVHLVALAV
jgi:hypothetical protein